MLGIVKKYTQIYKENGFGILSVRDTLIVILATIIFYYTGKNGGLEMINKIETTLISILAAIYAGDCLENEFFIEYNQEIKDKYSKVQKLVASNICFFLNVVLNIISLSIVDMYFCDISYGMQKGLTMVCFFVFGLGIGNLLLIKKVSNNTKLKVALTISIFYFVFFYNISSVLLLLTTVFAYGASIMLNKR